MNRDTVISYECAGKTVVFSARTPLWVVSITGASGQKVELTESRSAGQVGSTLSCQSVPARDITINGAVLSDVEANRYAILSCFVPGRTGRLTVTQGGESWYLDGAPTQTPEFEDGSIVQQWQAVLRCPYPYWKSTEKSGQMVAGLSPLFRFPRSLSGVWKISQYTDSLFANITNSGNMPMEFEAVLSADTEVDTPELYHVGRRALLRLNKVMEAGEKAVISTIYGSKGVTIIHPDSTEENGFRYLDIESDLNLQLDPGDNIIRYDAADNRDGLRVKILSPKGVRHGL